MQDSDDSDRNKRNIALCVDNWIDTRETSTIEYCGYGSNCRIAVITMYMLKLNIADLACNACSTRTS